jgi:hypothetical protein
MGSITDAITKLREQSKYLHVLSHAHKTLQESGELINIHIDINIFLFSTLVSAKNS